MATISIKDDVVMARIDEQLYRISNLRYFHNQDIKLAHGDKVLGALFRYDEINGERAFNHKGKYVRFKIIRAYL